MDSSLRFCTLQTSHEKSFLPALLKTLRYRRGPAFFPELFCDPKLYIGVPQVWGDSAITMCLLPREKWDDPCRYAFVYRWYTPGRVVNIRINDSDIIRVAKEPPRAGHVFSADLVIFEEPRIGVTPKKPKRRPREDGDKTYDELNEALFGSIDSM